MGENLTGTDARIWKLHYEGFCAAHIAGLVGLAEDYVRNVITGAWLDDKLNTKRSKKS